VSAMTTHINVSKVQEWGCLALGNLACNNVNRVSIAANHGIEAIMSAMTAHSNVSEMQEHGCLALANLAYNNDVICISIAAKHGIEAIVSAMMAHIMVSNVQERGCAALGNLACYNDANRVSIAAKGGIDAMMSAMTAHSNVSIVQERGSLTMLYLSLNKSVKIQLAGGLTVLEHNPSNSNGEIALQRIKALILLWFARFSRRKRLRKAA
jgi:hypothetical protein